MQHKIYVFDAYGTLFDIHSAVRAFSAEIGPKADRLSELWRSKQIEYTWILTLAGRYRPFDELTREALDFAAHMIGGLSAELKTRLMGAYAHLEAYADVAPVLTKLKATGAKIAIFSNGTPGMLAKATRAANLEGLIDISLSVDAIRLYKTHPLSYKLVTDYYQCAPSDIQFQSSNRWDVAGASAYGFTCNWVNRTGMPEEYAALAPARVISSLNELA